MAGETKMGGSTISGQAEGRLESSINSSTHVTYYQTTDLDTRILAQDISAAKRRHGAFETNPAECRSWLHHLIKRLSRLKVATLTALMLARTSILINRPPLGG
jgi:hypothetical protein